MNYKNATILVQFQELGENLVKAGQYTSAKVKVFEDKDENGKKVEKVLLLERSETISEPIYNKSSKSLKLGTEFISPLLERKTYADPDPKRRYHIPWQRRNRDIFNRFKTMSEKELVDVGVKHLVEDLGGDVKSISYEIFV